MTLWMWIGAAVGLFVIGYALLWPVFAFFYWFSMTGPRQKVIATLIVIVVIFVINEVLR